MENSRIGSIQDHSQEKVVIRKPKVMIKRSRVTLSLEKQFPQRFSSTINIFDTSFNHFHQNSVVSYQKYARNHPKDSKYRKTHQTAGS